MSPPPDDDLYGDEEFEDFQDDYESETSDEVASVASINATWPDPFDEGTESSSPPGDTADSQSVASGTGGVRRSPRRGQGAASASNASSSVEWSPSKGACAKKATSSMQEGLCDSDCESAMSETAAALRIQSAHRGREARRQASTRRRERDRKQQVTAERLSPIFAESRQVSPAACEAESPQYVESEGSAPQAAVDEVMRPCTAEAVLVRRHSPFIDAGESPDSSGHRRCRSSQELASHIDGNGAYAEAGESATPSRASMLTSECAIFSQVTVEAEVQSSAAQEPIVVLSDARSDASPFVRVGFQPYSSSASSACVQAQKPDDADTVASTVLSERQIEVSSSVRSSSKNSQVQHLIGYVVDDAVETLTLRSEPDDSASEAEGPRCSLELSTGGSICSSTAPVHSCSTAVNAPSSEPQPVAGSVCSSSAPAQSSSTAVNALSSDPQPTAGSACSSTAPVQSSSSAVDAPCSEPQPAASLAAIVNPPCHVAQTSPLFSVRTKAAAGLRQALISGKLEEELQGVQGRVLKQRALQTFIDATSAGTLQSALIVQAASERSVKHVVEERLEAEALTASWRNSSKMLALDSEPCTVEDEAREKAFRALVGASQRGELEKVIQGTELPLQCRRANTAPAGQMSSVPPDMILRRRLFDAFATAGFTGELQRALTARALTAPSQARRTVEILPRQEQVSRVPGHDDVESMRRRLAAAMLQGSKSGSLQHVLKQCQQTLEFRPPLASVSQDPEDTPESMDFKSALSEVSTSATAEVLSAVRNHARHIEIEQRKDNDSSSNPAVEKSGKLQLSQTRDGKLHLACKQESLGQNRVTRNEVVQQPGIKSHQSLNRQSPGDFRRCPAGAWAHMYAQFTARQKERDRPHLHCQQERSVLRGDFRECPSDAWVALHAEFGKAASKVPSLNGDFRKCPSSTWASLHGRFQSRSAPSPLSASGPAAPVSRELPLGAAEVALPRYALPLGVSQITSPRCAPGQIDDEAVAAACKAGAAIGIGDLLADFEADLLAASDGVEARDVADAVEDFDEGAGFFISAGGALAPSFDDAEDDDLIWAGRGNGQSAVLQAYVAATGALVAPDPASQAEAATRIQSIFRGSQIRRQLRESEPRAPEVVLSDVEVPVDEGGQHTTDNANMEKSSPSAPVVVEEVVTPGHMSSENTLRMQLEAKQVVMRVVLKVVCTLQEMRTRRLLEEVAQSRAAASGVNTTLQEPQLLPPSLQKDASQPSLSEAAGQEAGEPEPETCKASSSAVAAAAAPEASPVPPSVPRGSRPPSAHRPNGRVVSRPGSSQPMAKQGTSGKKAATSASAVTRRSAQQSPSAPRRHSSAQRSPSAPKRTSVRGPGNASTPAASASVAAGLAQSAKPSKEAANAVGVSAAAGQAKPPEKAAGRRQSRSQSIGDKEAETVSKAATDKQPVEVTFSPEESSEQVEPTGESDLQETAEADTEQAEQDYYEVSEEQFDRLMQAGCLQPSLPQPPQPPPPVQASDGTYFCDVSDAEFQLLLDHGVIDHVDFAYPPVSGSPRGYRSNASPQREVYSYGIQQGYRYMAHADDYPGRTANLLDGYGQAVAGPADPALAGAAMHPAAMQQAATMQQFVGQQQYAMQQQAAAQQQQRQQPTQEAAMHHSALQRQDTMQQQHAVQQQAAVHQQQRQQPTQEAAMQHAAMQQQVAMQQHYAMQQQAPQQQQRQQPMQEAAMQHAAMQQLGAMQQLAGNQQYAMQQQAVAPQLQRQQTTQVAPSSHDVSQTQVGGGGVTMAPTDGTGINSGYQAVEDLAHQGYGTDPEAYQTASYYAPGAYGGGYAYAGRPYSGGMGGAGSAGFAGSQHASSNCGGPPGSTAVPGASGTNSGGCSPRNYVSQQSHSGLAGSVAGGPSGPEIDEPALQSPTGQNSQVSLSSRNASPLETPRGERQIAPRTLPGFAPSIAKGVSATSDKFLHGKPRGSMLYHFPNTPDTEYTWIGNNLSDIEAASAAHSGSRGPAVRSNGRRSQLSTERGRSAMGDASATAPPEVADSSAPDQPTEETAGDVDVSTEMPFEPQASTSDSPGVANLNASALQAAPAVPLLPPLDVNAGRHRDPMVAAGGPLPAGSGARSARSLRSERTGAVASRRVGGRAAPPAHSRQRSDAATVARGRSVSPQRRQAAGQQVQMGRAPQPPTGPMPGMGARAPTMAGPPPPNGLSPRPPALGAPKVTTPRSKQALRFIRSADVTKAVDGGMLPSMPAMSVDLDSLIDGAGDAGGIRRLRAKDSSSPVGGRSLQRGRHAAGRKGMPPAC